MLQAAKQALRISQNNTAFDDEVTGLIDAARADLALSGVLLSKAQDDYDPLIKRAVLTYVKSNFGWDNPDSVKLQESYASLKVHLTLSQEYTVGDA